MSFIKLRGWQPAWDSGGSGYRSAHMKKESMKNEKDEHDTSNTGLLNEKVSGKRGMTEGRMGVRHEPFHPFNTSRAMATIFLVTQNNIEEDNFHFTALIIGGD